MLKTLNPKRDAHSQYSGNCTFKRCCQDFCKVVMLQLYGQHPWPHPNHAQSAFSLGEAYFVRFPLRSMFGPLSLTFYTLLMGPILWWHATDLYCSLDDNHLYVTMKPGTTHACFCPSSLKLKKLDVPEIFLQLNVSSISNINSLCSMCGCPVWSPKPRCCLWLLDPCYWSSCSNTVLLCTTETGDQN